MGQACMIPKSVHSPEKIHAKYMKNISCYYREQVSHLSKPKGCAADRNDVIEKSTHVNSSRTTNLFSKCEAKSRLIPIFTWWLYQNFAKFGKKLTHIFLVKHALPLSHLVSLPVSQEPGKDVISMLLCTSVSPTKAFNYTHLSNQILNILPHSCNEQSDRIFALNLKKAHETHFMKKLTGWLLHM